MEVSCVYLRQLLKYNGIIVYIYILNVFTEKPYNKPLERNEVYIPIITLRHVTSRDFKGRQRKP